MSEIQKTGNSVLDRNFDVIEQMLRAVVTNDRRPVASGLDNSAVSLVPPSRAQNAGNSFKLGGFRASHYATVTAMEELEQKLFLFGGR